MSHLRAACRIYGLVLVTGSCFLAWLTTRPLALLSRRAARRTEASLTGTWARTSAALLGIGIELRGDPPRPPFLLVSNHLSYVDVLVLWTRLDCVFLAKAEVARWPVLGFLARSLGTLFVDRTRRSDLPRVLAELERVLGAGRGLVVFPEGTSSPGTRVLPFKPPLFEVALRAGVPVSCAAISYRTSPGAPSAREAVCWWGDATFLPHFYRMLGLPSFRATLAFAPAPLTAADRGELSRAAQRAVTEQFTPVPG